jgi:hypothetical protein
MIKDSRYVPHYHGLVRDSQGHIVILSTVALAPEPSDLVHPGACDDEEMAPIHAAGEKVRRPVRLEGRPCPVPRFIQVILIAVDDVSRRGLDGLHHIVQRQRL